MRHLCPPSARDPRRDRDPAASPCGYRRGNHAGGHAAKAPLTFTPLGQLSDSAALSVAPGDAGRSKARTRPRVSPTRASRSSGLIVQQLMGSSPTKRASSSSAATSHSRSVPSLDQDRARSPSANTTAPETIPLCPSRGWLSPLVRSHRADVRSGLVEPTQDRARPPSRQQHRASDPSVCPSSARLWPRRQVPQAQRAVSKPKSPDHDRARAPSANTTAPVTRRVPFERPAAPLARSHRRNTWSSDAKVPAHDRARAPSANTTAPVTRTLCPSSARLSPLARSHRRSVWSLTRTGRARRRPAPPRQ